MLLPEVKYNICRYKYKDIYGSIAMYRLQYPPSLERLALNSTEWAGGGGGGAFPRTRSSRGGHSNWTQESVKSILGLLYLSIKKNTLEYFRCKIDDRQKICREKSVGFVKSSVHFDHSLLKGTVA